jgi:hypothetical protein
MELIEELSHDQLILYAARVAKTFQIDPVDVLRDDGDELLAMVRVAAVMVVQRDEEEAARRAKASSSRGRGRRR